ncbi:MAG: GIY-YIG nuclease family protein [Saprospiraceae bacterium]|nr:GIY-YIG nuclease family protein [Saprospiraceae bacterium]
MAIIQKFVYVYIIHCSDDSYYVGVTNSLKDRYMHHELGTNPKAYTYRRRPLKALYWEIRDSAMDGILREKQLKGWTRAKKRALIEGNISELKRLSASFRRAQ